MTHAPQTAGTVRASIERARARNGRAESIVRCREAGAFPRDLALDQRHAVPSTKVGERNRIGRLAVDVGVVVHRQSEVAVSYSSTPLHQHIFAMGPYELDHRKSERWSVIVHGIGGPLPVR